MKGKVYFLFPAIIGALFTAGCTSKQNKPAETASMDMACSQGVSVKAMDLKINMRKLWEDHIIWTRNVICCLVDGLPGSDQALKRLLQNQEDIGNAIKPVYGEDAGKKLTALLLDHIKISADVINAAKAGDKDKLNGANKRWTANADEISTFFCHANPRWKLDEMKSMMHDHLKLTTDEAVARIKKDYEADIKAYDKVHGGILQMSDMLADGIINQFPGKF